MPPSRRPTVYGGLCILHARDRVRHKYCVLMDYGLWAHPLSLRHVAPTRSVVTGELPTLEMLSVLEFFEEDGSLCISSSLDLNIVFKLFIK